MFGVLIATYSDHPGRWWFPVFPLLFLGFWAAVIFTLSHRWRHSYRHTGESVLAERYARGEIDEAEFRRRRTELRRKD